MKKIYPKPQSNNRKTAGRILPVFRCNLAITSFSALLLLLIGSVLAVPAQNPQASSYSTVAEKKSASYQASDEVIAQIKDEGLKRSQVLQTANYISDVIGARLTGSTQLKRANDWTREQLTRWGLQNSHLEAWGPFGKSWTLNGFEIEVVAPYAIPLIGYPKAWSPATDGTLNAEVVYFDVQTESDFEKYKNLLKGKAVLVSAPRPLEADFAAFGRRQTAARLAEMSAFNLSKDRAQPAEVSRENLTYFLQSQNFAARQLNFLMREGAAVVIDNSPAGSGGTIFVQEALLNQDIPLDPFEYFSEARLQPWHKSAAGTTIPQITLSTEHYNRLVRMLQAGEKLKLKVNLQTKFSDAEQMGYNTVAEIPGTDPQRQDEIVLLGGHLDSWHAGTGATDNAAGVAVAMEAVRIIQALNLKPRRTIRIALWSGEEQGLFGSRAYVAEHFTASPDMVRRIVAGMLGEQTEGPIINKKPAYEKLSAYYNLDNGTGKIRGIYLQGNEKVKPLFEAWLARFADLGASTVTLLKTGGTDHVSFDAAGLPGFQFIQDPIEYETRTHHSNQDVFDRLQAEDLKQASVIMAAFVYQTAMLDEKLPRK